MIRTRINELGAVFKIRENAIHPWNATQPCTQLEGDGFEVVPFGQVFQDMTEPTKEFEKLVVSGTLRHGGYPVVRWMASNVAVEMDAAANLRPSKKKIARRFEPDLRCGDHAPSCASSGAHCIRSGEADGCVGDPE